MVSRRRFITSSVLLGGAGLASMATPGYAGSDAAATARGRGLDVREFGAVGDGESDDTRAIQRAVDAAHRRGGGTVELPPGTWLSGTVRLRSRVTLDLAPGAVLLASPDADDFAAPERPSFETGSDTETVDFAHAFLTGRELEHVAIVGGGTIDMNRHWRFGPKPIALKRCRWVTVRGITIVRSPNYCVSLGGCDDVVIDGVTIREAYADGIDPDCCRRVRIANCDVESDDDALCLKASFLLGIRAATEDVVVANCRLRSPSNCFKLGTESTGDFRQIVLSNCVFSGLPPAHHGISPAAEGGGIAILSVDGGTIDGVMVSNVVMTDVPAPLFVRLGNRGRDQAAPTPGRLRNVTISGVVATGATETGSIAGLPDHPVEHVTLENVRIEGAGGSERARTLDVPEQESDYPEVTMYGPLPAFGLYLRHGRGIVLRNVELGAEGSDSRPALVADDVSGLQLVSLTGGSPNAVAPVVWLNDVQGGLVQANLPPEDVGVFLRVTGEATRRVALVGNAYCSTEHVEIAPEITPGTVVRETGEHTPPTAGRRLESG